MAGLFEPRQRAQLLDPALHVALSGLPVVGLDAVLFSSGSEAKRLVAFTAATMVLPG
jgi:hypothetical protein